VIRIRFKPGGSQWKDIEFAGVGAHGDRNEYVMPNDDHAVCSGMVEFSASVLPHLDEYVSGYLVSGSGF
jgi:hypothetical protein